MVFSRFLEWKEENLIAIGRLKMSCGQRDCEWLYPLKASGTKDTLIHIHAWDEHSLSRRKLFNCRMSVRGRDRLCECHWVYLFSRQMCPLWQNASLAAKCITMLHLLREGSVANEFHARKRIFTDQKGWHLGSTQTEVVSKNNRADLWLIVQRPTPSIFH